MPPTETIALIIFIITYTGIIFTRLPWLTVDRPSSAFFGAVAIILFGVLSFDEAVKAIDYNTIALLLGMMIIISVLELDGFFSLIAHKTISFSKSRKQLLFIITFVTGIASAFLVNDAVVLLFTPVIIKICQSGKLNPVPFLIAEIMSSNAGSALTITGNPQNILIGINSNLAYGKFMLVMLPVSLLSMLAIYFIVLILYRKEFNKEEDFTFADVPESYNYKSMNTSVPIFILVVAGFFLSKAINISYSMIALAGGSLILLLGRIKPSKIIKQVDWVLLLFFASLFIVVTGAEKAGLLNFLMNLFQIKSGFSGVLTIHLSSLVLSQVVSNVPFTILMLPILKPLQSDVLWMALASSSTLAGNLTIIGAMANLIVIEIAGASKIQIGFFQFLKVGTIVTAISFIISLITLWVIY
jgi:Na+/H+ antiporter NhaD/arsenite permease-like protein